MSELINPDYTKSLGNVCFRLYDKFDICLPIKDWAFMCERRWFSDMPKLSTVEAEFGVCGAHDAQNNEEANAIVQKAVNAYKRMMHADIEEECRNLLDSTSKTVARVDDEGHIYFEEVQD